MTEAPRQSAADLLAGLRPETAAAFRSLRNSVKEHPALPAATGDLIVLATFAVTGNEAGFKVHARRMLREGAEIEALRQAVIVTLGHSTTFAQATNALRWIDAAAG
jgi:alkylhydroperoxidase/carboxymuconolactone decarboxylase family protein YurZ